MANLLPQLQNVPRSSGRGIELEAAARPIWGLSLSGGITYVHSSVDGNYSTPDPLGNLLNVKGEPFPNTPQWQLLADMEYDFPVASTFNAYVGSNTSYRSASNAAFGANPEFRMKGYALLGVRAGFGDVNDKWRIEAWGRNVTNEFYWTNTQYYIDAVSRTVGMPATYGLTLSTRF